MGGVAEGVSVLRRRAVEGEAVAGDIWLCRGSGAGGGWLWVWLEGVAKGVVQGVWCLTANVAVAPMVSPVSPVGLKSLHCRWWRLIVYWIGGVNQGAADDVWMGSGWEVLCGTWTVVCYGEDSLVLWVSHMRSRTVQIQSDCGKNHAIWNMGSMLVLLSKWWGSRRYGGRKGSIKELVRSQSEKSPSTAEVQFTKKDCACLKMWRCNVARVTPATHVSPDCNVTRCSSCQALGANLTVRSMVQAICKIDAEASMARGISPTQHCCLLRIQKPKRRLSRHGSIQGKSISKCWN